MSEQNKPQAPPTPLPQKPPREVHVSCRGSNTCDGIKAQVVFEKPNDGGGKMVRYKCVKCGKTWHINY